MSYTTIGTISFLKWSTSSAKVTIKIDPTSSYAFEENSGASVNKAVLWKNGNCFRMVPSDSEYEINPGRSSMDFSALLLLKQNRSKVELECDKPTKAPRVISCLSVKS